MRIKLIGWSALEPQLQAAWAHAFLSFLGILVAVAVPLWLQWLSKRRAASVAEGQARSLTAGLVATLSRSRATLRAFGQDPPLLEPERNLDAQAALKHLEIPPKLGAYSDRLHLFGQASNPLQEFYVRLVLLRADLEDLQIHQQYNLPNPPDDTALLRRIREVDGVATEVLRRFADMFPSASGLAGDGQ